MGQDENSIDIANKLYKTIQTHLQVDDISKGLKALRALSEMSESRKGLNRPMVQLYAAKALIEIYVKMAELEVKSNTKPESHITNIYNTLSADGEKDDIIALSQRVNRGLSNFIKR